MKLIHCPDCSTEISPTVSVCPNCGYVIFYLPSWIDETTEATSGPDIDSESDPVDEPAAVGTSNEI